MIYKISPNPSLLKRGEKERVLPKEEKRNFAKKGKEKAEMANLITPKPKLLMEFTYEGNRYH